MPPVGRSKKVGLRRVDAALDALLPLGFRKNVVINTVNRLLKVYGGDSGWAFIEEGSYKLVIETLLEDQENGALKKDDSHKGVARDLSDTLIIGMTSTDPGEGRTSDDPGGDLQSTDTKCLDQEKTYLVRKLRADPGSCSPRVQGENICWKDITCDDYPESFSLEMGQQYVARLEAELGLDIEESRPTAKRKPCFGWLDEEDDKVDKILHLEASNGPLHGTPDEDSYKALM